MASIANLVRLYLKNKPYIVEALEKDIVNLSSLSRKIAEEIRIENLVAIKAALRRYAIELRKKKQRREEKVLAILKNSRINFYDGISVIIVETPVKLKSRFEIRLSNAIVYVIEDKDEEIPKKYLALHKDCGIFIVNSPKEIEKTPGVVAYLTSLLAEENINVIEFISCYTDTILIVERKDVLKTYEVLSRVIG